MKMDYTLLTQLIVEKFGKHYAFAAAIGLSEKTLSQKLNNNAAWNQKEIHKAMMLLETDALTVDELFFNYIDAP